VKLNDHDQLDGGVTVYQPNKTPFAGSIIHESSA